MLALRSLRALRTTHLRPLLARYNSTLPPGTSKDPAHPHLYYHLTPPPPSAPKSVLISYLPATPLESSSTYLGSLPAGPAGLNDFRENPRFRPLLHKSIKEAIESGKAETVDYEAGTRPGDGYMHLIDERNLPPPGRVGDAEDLIASIFVQDGKVVPSTYEPLPTYRLVTGEGVLTLPRGIDEYVVSVLEKVDREEKAKAE